MGHDSKTDGKTQGLGFRFRFRIRVRARIRFRRAADRQAGMHMLTDWKEAKHEHSTHIAKGAASELCI